MDALANFAASTVATAPSPATSGVSLVVATGDGAKFPTPPFYLTMWPAGALPTTANAEIARCTAIATDTLTIVRGQESTTGKSVAIGYQVAQNITAGLLNQLVPTVLTGTLPADVTLVGATDTTIMTTSSLAVGTWNLAVQADFLTTAGGGPDAIKAILGTATATFSGPQTNDIYGPGGASMNLMANLNLVVVVTVAGTIKINAQSLNGDTVKRLGGIYTTLVGTGWTATKVL